jgi:AraC-like DNA-binding protein
LKRVYYLKSVTSGLIDLLELFVSQKKLKVSKSSYNSNVDKRIPFNKWLSLLNIIEQNYPKPTLGLEIATYVQPSHLGTLGYIGLSCESLLEALPIFIKYQRLCYDFMQMTVSMQNENIIVNWGVDTNFQAGKLADETMIAIFFNIVNLIVAPNRVKLNKVEFVFERPNNSRSYEKYFECDVEFSKDKTRMYFAQSNLNLPINKADPVLKNILSRQADILLAELPKVNSFDELVRQKIINAIHQGNISIEYVASKVGLPTRIFQYKLQKQGYSFKQRLNQARKGLALQYLEDRSLNINEISALLAYNEQSSFNRAFKSWFGISPVQWRKEFNSEDI